MPLTVIFLEEPSQPAISARAMAATEPPRTRLDLHIGDTSRKKASRLGNTPRKQLFYPQIAVSRNCSPFADRERRRRGHISPRAEALPVALPSGMTFASDVFSILFQ